MKDFPVRLYKYSLKDRKGKVNKGSVGFFNKISVKILGRFLGQGGCCAFCTNHTVKHYPFQTSKEQKNGNYLQKHIQPVEYKHIAIKYNERYGRIL